MGGEELPLVTAGVDDALGNLDALYPTFLRHQP